MSSMNKPLSNAKLSAHEARRDLAAELLQSVKEMKAGQVQLVSSPVVEPRQKTGTLTARIPQIHQLKLDP